MLGCDLYSSKYGVYNYVLYSVGLYYYAHGLGSIYTSSNPLLHGYIVYMYMYILYDNIIMYT